MSDHETLPYKTINVFLEEDYLHNLLESILKDRQSLPKQDQISFTKSFNEHIKVLGFRNPSRAPLPLQVNAYADAFEEKDEVVPFTLSTWAKIHSDFVEKVKQWLLSEGWNVLPLEREFNEGDGFEDSWPEGLSFEDLTQKFKKAHPDESFDEDDLALMVVWISGQLPEEQSNI